MAPPAARSREPRTVWLYKGQLLVAQLTEGPGAVRPTGRPAEDGTPDHAWAHGQCMSVEWEEDIRRALAECSTFDELLRRMKYYKYRIDPKGPQHRRRPFTRL
jgi:hypothetical protein